MSKAIRGAINAENTKTSIKEKAPELLKKIIEENKLDMKLATCLIISHTKDLTVLNSATALRMAGLVTDTPLFCVQEANIDGGMPLTIRMMLITDQDIKTVKHVYLGNTSKLRPDISIL